MDKIIEDFRKARDTEDLTAPHNCGAGYVYSDMGVDIEEEHKFQEELHGIVDKMKEDLVHEKKILEGTLEPEYNPNEVKIEKFVEGESFTTNQFVQNELSKSNSEYKQWMLDCMNGSSKTDHTHISSDELSTSSCTAKPSNQVLDTRDYDEKYPEPSTILCPEISVSYGKEIGPLNEQFDSMVQMINVPMLGTPSEEK